jgi:hypothetical protein
VVNSVVLLHKNRRNAVLLYGEKFLQFRFSYFSYVFAEKLNFSQTELNFSQMKLKISQMKLKISHGLKFSQMKAKYFARP